MDKKKCLVVGLLASVLTAFIVFGAGFITMWQQTLNWDTRVFGLEVLDAYGNAMSNNITLTAGSNSMYFVLHNNGSVPLNITIISDLLDIGSANFTWRYDYEAAVFTMPPIWQGNNNQLWTGSPVTLVPGLYNAFLLVYTIPNGQLGSYSFDFVRVE